MDKQMGVTLAGVASTGIGGEDIDEMAGDQIKIEIQEARNRLGLKDQMFTELLRARSAVPKLRLEVRAMVHALHSVRKELAASSQLVQSLHTQMTYERQQTEELQRLKDKPSTVFGGFSALALRQPHAFRLCACARAVKHLDREIR
jgi:hypothetical protein